MGLVISSKVQQKLTQKHGGISEDEISQCFANMEKGFLVDDREKNKSTPPTRWFIAETDYGRRLKVVFIYPINGNTVIKTAYEPNDTEIQIYQNKAKNL
ncbi:MAG: hypothetical protein V7731_16155 [Amphritea sp.]